MERIGRDVERELARTGSGHGLALAHVTSAWPEVVGEAVARQAWPLRLGRYGTLHVATSSATWAFELDRLAPEIHARLARALGDEAPAALRFRVGPLPEPARSEPSDAAAARSPALSPDVSAKAATAAAEIEDPELRDLVARAARASLSRSPGRGTHEVPPPSRDGV